jgi:DNA processing protein
MSAALSPNTQAILLLTAPLLIGREKPSEDLLLPGEYKRLAKHLREIQHQPAELLSPDAPGLLRACHTVIDESRLKRLLARGFLLSQAVERWQTRAIWVASRADSHYPQRLKARLRENAPAVLYGCGDVSLLDTGGLAVVGSRHVEDALLEYTTDVARLAAKSGKTLISGDAKGIDQAAMRGAIEAGGHVCGVLADSLEKKAMSREYRSLLLDGRLALISPYDPNAGFNIGHAMQRNKVIYTLADAALVVNADLEKGGTWSGAVEQLDKLHLVPVYVRSTGAPSVGLSALRSKGASDWPNPQDTAAFLDTLATPPIPQALSPAAPETETGQAPAQDGSTPAALLFSAVREVITQLLSVPRKESEIASALDISPAQTRKWLQRLVEAGVLEKQKKTAVYMIDQGYLFRGIDAVSPAASKALPNTNRSAM